MKWQLLTSCSCLVISSLVNKNICVLCLAESTKYRQKIKIKALYILRAGAEPRDRGPTENTCYRAISTAEKRIWQPRPTKEQHKAAYWFPEEPPCPPASVTRTTTGWRKRKLNLLRGFKAPGCSRAFQFGLRSVKSLSRAPDARGVRAGPNQAPESQFPEDVATDPGRAQHSPAGFRDRLRLRKVF